MRQQYEKLILDYVRENQPCKATEIMSGTKVKHSSLYKFLKSDHLIKERVLGGSGSPKGGGFYYLYSINKYRKDPSPCDRIKPIRISHHPIMQAMYSL